MKIGCIYQNRNLKNTILPYSNPISFAGRNDGIDRVDISNPVKYNPSSLHFRDELTENEKNFLRMFNVSNDRNYVLNRLLLLTDKEGKRVCSNYDIRTFADPDRISDKRIKRIIKRKMFDKTLIKQMPDAISDFSLIDDNKWREIEPYAFEMYQTFYNAGNTAIISAYRDGIITYDELLKQYSSDKILNLFGITGIIGRLKNSFQVKLISSKLDKADSEASNLGMILDLVQEGKLSNKILRSITMNSKLNKNAEDDLERLYFAYINNLDVKEAFIPDYEDKNSALDMLNTGDVCTIEGEKNIRIKTSDTKLNRIWLSKDAYFKLCPPVERFAFIQSDDMGDCYFISTIDAIYSNPDTRYKLLNVFKENDDGTISVNFGGWRYKNGEIVRRDKNKKTYTFDFPQDDYDSSVAYSSPLLKILEKAYDMETKDTAYKQIMQRYGEYKTLLKENSNKDSFIISGFVYSKDEIESYIKRIDELEGRDDILSAFVPYGLKNPDAVLSDDKAGDFFKNMKEKLDDNPDKSEFDLKYIEYMEKRAYFKEFFPLYNEIMPRNVYMAAVRSDMCGKYCTMFRNGGNSKEIYKLFNMGCSNYTIDDFLDAIYDNRIDKNCSITVSTKEDAGKIKNRQLISNHTYSLYMDEDKKIIIKNPHNSSQETELDIKDLVDNFQYATVGYKKPF